MWFSQTRCKQYNEKHLRGDITHTHTHKHKIRLLIQFENTCFFLCDFVPTKGQLADCCSSTSIQPFIHPSSTGMEFVAWLQFNEQLHGSYFARLPCVSMSYGSQWAGSAAVRLQHQCQWALDGSDPKIWSYSLRMSSTAWFWYTMLMAMFAQSLSGRIRVGPKTIPMFCIVMRLLSEWSITLQCRERKRDTVWV